MASVTKDQIPEISQFMTEFWKLVKEFWVTEHNDDYWECVVESTGDLYKKFPDDFCKKQLLAFVEYLEGKSKGGKT